VRAGDAIELGRALTGSGIHVVALGDGGYRAEADPELVGKVAYAAGVPLHELRAADGAGLEEMFLELTAETSREGAAA
jgi:ABC-2 type transport system ATP-binding protein